MAPKYGALKELCWCPSCGGEHMRDPRIICSHVEVKGYHSQAPQSFIDKYRAILQGKPLFEGNNM
jgi:hypothetical protein